MGEKSKKLTWDELANFYDKSAPFRRARTLPMDYVFNWAARQKNRFIVHRDGTISLRAKEAQNE